MNFTLLKWLIVGHFIGDFAFQHDWMATTKGKSWEVNLYHVSVYTATLVLTSKIGDFDLPLLAVAIIFLSHFFIEPLSSRWGIIKAIWLDQILHILILILIAIFF